jgi:hypothetical protein
VGNSNQVYQEVGEIIGRALARKDDNKKLAMADSMTANFKSFRNGEISGQEYFDAAKKAWDGAENVKQ